MNATLRRRFEMAVRVRDFLRAHPIDGAAEGAALADLEALIERADTLASQQRAGVVASRAATEQRLKVRGALHADLLRYLAGVGIVAARENAELGAQFRLPELRSSHQAFLTMVHGMLEKATAVKDLLVKRGMSATLLDDLAAAVAEYEKTLEATRAAHRDHVGAGGDLREVAAQISEQVKLLDGLVHYRFGKNAELMTAWAAVKNVLGPFKHAQPQDSAGGTAPQNGVGSPQAGGTAPSQDGVSSPQGGGGTAPQGSGSEAPATVAPGQNVIAPAA
ncbi:MAG TPA: hypothetical protein VLV45_14625 [Gemmatimonadales bacterium]|nr:hypothetical protein [Gemmatimonadales bacterium]